MEIVALLRGVISELERMDAVKPLAEGGMALRIARERLEDLESRTEPEARVVTLRTVMWLLLDDPRALASAGVQNDLQGAGGYYEQRLQGS